MKNMRLSLKALLLLTLVTALISCGGDDKDDNDKDKEPNLTTFTIALSGDQTVPPYDGEDTATADITLNEDTMALTVAMDLASVAGVTAAHIHAGEIGTNGAVIIPFTNLRASVWGVEEEVLTGPQYDSLMAGEWYINVHTTEKADGEIRGQIIPENMTLFTFPVEPNQEVPSTESTASGHGYALLNSDNNEFHVAVVTEGVAATMAHIHTGQVGLNGGVMIGLEQNATDANLWQTPLGYTLEADGMAALNAGELYANIHSQAYPGGEIRGQILPEEFTLAVFPINGAQEVPPVMTEARGIGYASVNTSTGALQLNAWTFDLMAHAAHIHAGLPGVNGDVVITLSENDDTAGLWQTPANTTLDSAALITLLAAGHYVNFHTAEYPSGEIRGQIFTAPAVEL